MSSFIRRRSEARTHALTRARAHAHTQRVAHPWRFKGKTKTAQEPKPTHPTRTNQVLNRRIKTLSQNQHWSDAIHAMITNVPIKLGERGAPADDSIFSDMLILFEFTCHYIPVMWSALMLGWQLYSRLHCLGRLLLFFISHTVASCRIFVCVVLFPVVFSCGLFSKVNYQLVPPITLVRAALDDTKYHHKCHHTLWIIGDRVSPQTG